tara:strand:- start:495 stop:740 length:246 start_codon:yes stop_codon:yes gene_type:complete
VSIRGSLIVDKRHRCLESEGDASRIKTSHPAISVPCGFTPEGLPVGVQIVGRYRDDFGVLQLAHAFEEATGFSTTRPAVAG